MVTYILLLTALALCSLSAAAPEQIPQPLPKESEMGEYHPVKAVQSAVAADPENPGGDHQSTATSQQPESDLDTLLRQLLLERISGTAAAQNPGDDHQSTATAQLSEGDVDTLLQYLHLRRVSESTDLPAAQNPGGDRQSTATAQLSEDGVDTLLQDHLERVSESTVQTIDCGRQYHEALSGALRIKAECDSAAFYDCCQVQEIVPFLNSGKYEISEVCDLGPFEASHKQLAICDMETDGGGWLVIQRRVSNDSIDFYRGWNDYERGFGDLDSEFWYGLKNIHCLTTRDEVELRIDLEDESGNKVTWVYQLFNVAGPEDKYRLTIGQGEGTPGSFNAMAYHNGYQFSTFDQDNDVWSGNCASSFRGGWWYVSCHHSNLNGDHDGSTTQRPVWHDGSDHVYYPYIEMKIRRKNCSAEGRCPEIE